MNLILDYTILRILGSIIKRKSTFLKCFLTSFTGSCLLCLICIFDIDILISHSFLIALLVNTVTLRFVFCKKGDGISFLLEVLIKFYLVSFLLAGVIEAVYIASGVSWWCVCLVVLMLRIIIKPLMKIVKNRKISEGLYYDVMLWFGEESVAVKGFLDTGNHLLEPISGKPVHVLEFAAAKRVLSEGFLNAVREYYENEVLGNGLYLEKGIRMVPFCSVGAPKEKLLVAVTADSMIVKLNGCELIEEKPYIALFNGELARDASYQMLLHATEKINGRE